MTTENRKSWLKLCGAVVAIMAGLVTVIVGMVKLPGEVSAAVAASVQTKLDERYVQIKDNDHDSIRAYADKRAAESTIYADDIKKSIVGEVQASEKRTIDELHHLSDRVDRMSIQTSYIHGIIRGETPAPYAPLPRNQSK
jgi:hypothetical protein